MIILEDSQKMSSLLLLRLDINKINFNRMKDTATERKFLYIYTLELYVFCSTRRPKTKFICLEFERKKPIDFLRAANNESESEFKHQLSQQQQQQRQTHFTF